MLSNSAEVRALQTNLPGATTSFVGRAIELETVSKLLRKQRLVTITGPSGAGKTRLALEMGRSLLATYAHGVWLCELVGVVDPNLIIDNVYRALGLEIDLVASLDGLIYELSNRQLLIVLDNCEHLLASCAALTQRLLQQCPSVSILVTSLQPLGLPSEQIWPLAPLALPLHAPDRPLEFEQLQEYDAIRLFVERAAAIAPHFALTPTNAADVLTICQRLDGLPLALELAAARVNVLSVSEIAIQLAKDFRLLSRNRFATQQRHQTLLTTINWSYQFLADDEQQALCELAVFSGPFTLEAAQAIINQDALTTLDRLSNLVDKSFLTRVAEHTERDSRFQMLETVRYYAREQLERTGQAVEVRNRLLHWAITLAEQAEPHLFESQQQQWYNIIDSNHDNLRAALRWVRVTRNAGAGLRIVRGIWRFWFRHGFLIEGQTWTHELLTMAQHSDGSYDPTIDSSVLAHTLSAAGHFAYRQGNYRKGFAYAEASVTLFRATTDQIGLSRALLLFGSILFWQQDYLLAHDIFQEALLSYRQRMDRWGLTSTLNNLSMTCQRMGDFPWARRYVEEALEILRQNDSYIAPQLHTLGHLLLVQGDLQAANTTLTQAYTTAQQAADTTLIGDVLADLGEVARHQGDLPAAEHFFQESLQLRERIGEAQNLAYSQINFGDLMRVSHDFLAAQKYYESAIQRATQQNDNYCLSIALYGLGMVQLAQSQEEKAAQSFQQGLTAARIATYIVGQLMALEGIALTLCRGENLQAAALLLAGVATQRQQLGVPVANAEQLPIIAAQATLREQLTPSIFDTLWQTGGAATFETLIAIANGEQQNPLPLAQLVEEETKAPIDLHIVTLGSTQVFVDGQPIAANRWVYQKAKELFYYLATQPATSKAQIGIDIWPEASNEQLRSGFHRAMYHIRQALGKPDWVVFSNHTYRFSSQISIWCDVHVLEACIKEAALHMRTAQTNAVARANAIEVLQQAVNLWQGDFLSDMNAGEWAIIRSEEVRQRYLQAVLDLGQLYIADSNYTKAAQIYRKAIELDDYLEIAHRELMRSYARQGEASQAMRHYLNLRQLLRNELHAEPAPETTMLYERLLHGDDI
jgi:non-specific serine/threonine protein kinase